VATGVKDYPARLTRDLNDESGASERSSLGSRRWFVSIAEMLLEHEQKPSERTKLLETIRWIDLIGRVHLRDAPGTGPRPSERAKEAELAS
jgi:hypothetical protein